MSASAQLLELLTLQEVTVEIKMAVRTVLRLSIVGPYAVTPGSISYLGPD